VDRVDGKKFVGYIDIGTGLDDDSMPVAKIVVAAQELSLELALRRWYQSGNSVRMLLTLSAT